MLLDVDVDNDVIELVAVDSPVEVEVDSDVTLLSVVDKPVDSELMPLDVEVDNDVIELTVLDRPVDVEVDKLLIAVFVAYSCEPLTASVLVDATWPAAKFVIWRSAPGAPTLTTLDGALPA
ncbi:ATPase [Burkholderia arboris]|uniref:ATPase n=1 Tax=Burkholderia arboris TaxID=488730 RepID=A0A9Q9SRI9_9BURK|nr:ATPase [Burkholderia arboris]